VSKKIHEKMHEQHQHWRRDLESWQSDVAAWKQALEAAVADLREVEGMLQDSLDGLGVHADAIWEALQRVKAHEQVVGEESKLGENKTDREWQAAHEALSSQHARLADRHARLKTHHHEVVAEVTRTLKQARKAV
jgi:DNA repair exonuclease SbcCD ATPase subunit